MRDPYIHVAAKAKNETELAFLCTFEYDGVVFNDHWIPKSQIHESSHSDIDEACEGDDIEILVKKWWLDRQ